MAEIRLVRADFRLIHGQVITKWVKQTLSNMILIIDDTLADDEFMKSIYIMSAPPGIEVVVHKVDEAVSAWREGKYENAKMFVLFKNIETAYRAYNDGFPIEDFQIGGLGSAPGRQVVFGPITLDDKDAKLLKEMQDKGCHVYFHQVPEDPSMEYTKILDKYKFNI